MGDKVESFSTKDIVPTKKKVKLFSFDPTLIDWKFKVKQGARRLKLYIKMNKDETLQWDTVKTAAKPPEMSDNEFARILFYKGIQAFMVELSEHVNKMSDEDKEKLIKEHGLSEDTEESSSDE